jgi:hypothetical protein
MHVFQRIAEFIVYSTFRKPPQWTRFKLMATMFNNPTSCFYKAIKYHQRPIYSSVGNVHNRIFVEVSHSLQMTSFSIYKNYKCTIIDCWSFLLILLTTNINELSIIPSLPLNREHHVGLIDLKWLCSIIFLAYKH